MGNTKSSSFTLIEGIKRAQETQANSKLYQLVDLQGGGELVQWMKYAMNSGDNSILDGLVEIRVTKFLYNDGKGKLLPISELVKQRNEERNAMLGALRRKKGKGKSGPNILEQVNQAEMQGDMMKALKMLDGGGGKGGKGGSKYRELCTDLKQRGAMGESLIHLCLQQGTFIHNMLAKKLITAFPKLVNDIYLSEAYYGNSPLHQAIVNEDPGMVHFLLQQGADVHQRCYGAYFSPDDQRDSRTDSLEHEWVDMNQKTDYKGSTYFGEYPLSFAVCTGQEECFRLVRAKKADPNMRDTNGNTCLHLSVIHEIPRMFYLAHRLGAKLHVTNNQNYTSLTLAARLAKKKMFEHVLNVERSVNWTYGEVESASYPLRYIDTIEERTGELNPLSALSLIVYGESNAHLDLLDGLMEELLQEKWSSFAKRELIKNFSMFLTYFVIFFMACIFRDNTHVNHNVQNNSSLVSMSDDVTDVLGSDNDTMSLLDAYNSTAHTEPAATGIWGFYAKDQCHLLHLHDELFPMFTITRWCFECLAVLGALFFAIGSFMTARNLGWKKYLNTMLAFPERLTFHLSFLCMFTMVPLRFACLPDLENVIAILTMLLTSIYFLFFCRGIKFVGPFVLMVYKIVTGDLLRFIIIYIIVAIGFSQSFFIIFLGCHRGKSEEEKRQALDWDAVTQSRNNILASPAEAILRMFIMSLGEFTLIYRNMHDCRLAVIGKVLFFVFEFVVSVMLINLLIAMMARTYQEIVETQKEWKRQWAKVILMLEMTLNPRDRLLALLKYSRPIGTDKTKRAFVVRRKLNQMEAGDLVNSREKKWQEFAEERRAMMKKKLLEFSPSRLAHYDNEPH